ETHLLAPGRGRLRGLGDRRHLPKEPQSVETPLIDGAGGPGQLRGPPHLALDFLDELADLGRCRLGCWRFLRRFGRSIDRRGSHSITSSARATSVGGTSRPIAFAVLRLITNSNLFGAWTGRL